ncbi:MAG: hypothetical protein HY283_00760 [Nitrospirae bacterium]|nr:hypothetical protein [Nitrospirota bacterium]
MLELTLVILTVTAVLAVQWMMQISFPASTLTDLGLFILAAGIIEGIPTGLYYHVVLYRLLHRRGRLPSGWWISPSRYHVHLTEMEGRRVRRWFFLGGLGFLLCMVGGLMALSGVMLGTF